MIADYFGAASFVLAAMGGLSAVFGAGRAFEFFVLIAAACMFCALAVAMVHLGVCFAAPNLSFCPECMRGSQ